MAKKKPKRASFADLPHRPQRAYEPPTEKRPFSVGPVGSNHLFPSWRIGILEMAHDRLGWHRLDRFTLDRIRARMASLETMTWSQIQIEGKKHNHSIPISDLSREARDWLEARSITLDEVISLRLSGQERIFGYRQNEVFVLLWWDPFHEICPSQKKHT